MFSTILFTIGTIKLQIETISATNIHFLVSLSFGEVRVQHLKTLDNMTTAQLFRCQCQTKCLRSTSYILYVVGCTCTMTLCGVSGCVVYAGQGRSGRKSWGCQTTVLHCNSRRSRASLSVKTAIIFTPQIVIDSLCRYATWNCHALL